MQLFGRYFSFLDMYWGYDFIQLCLLVRLLLRNRCYMVWVLQLLTVKHSCLSVRFNMINCEYDSENLLKVRRILREFKAFNTLDLSSSRVSPFLLFLVIWFIFFT